MAFSTPKSAFLAGMRDSIPFLFVAGPFGMLFGVLAMLWIMSRFMKLSTVFGGAAR